MTCQSLLIDHIDRDRWHLTSDVLFTLIDIAVVILMSVGSDISAVLSACHTLLVGVVAAKRSFGTVGGIDSADPVRFWFVR